MKPRVLYIAGQAFSGSTIFCALLGVHPAMEPSSELFMWTKYGLDPERVCACGKLSTDCEFWSAVRAQWLNGSHPNTLPRYIQLQERIESTSYAWPYLLGAKTDRSNEYAEYARLTTTLYQSLCSVSGRPIIVDSSKKPGRANAISAMDGLDVTILHLVRNGLSYVDSNIKRNNLSPREPDFLRKVMRLGLRWSITNYAAERAMLMSRSGGVRIRYEDLLSDPDGSLDSVGRAAGIDVKSIRDHIASGKPISYRHMESGSRHRTSGPAALRLGPLPAVKLESRVRLAFYAGAGLLSLRYGYI